MNNVFVLGSINMDLVFELDHLPKQGETIYSKHFFMNPGGKGANQAVACQKLGSNTYMIGSVGSDGLSKQCIKSLEENNVNTDFISIVEEITCGVAGILLENNDNRIILDAGANLKQDIRKITKLIQQNTSQNDILLCQLEIPIDIVEIAFKEAKKHHLYTALNTAPAKKLPISIFPYIDLLICNEVELETLTDITLSSKQEIIKAMDVLLDNGANEVLVTLGEKGSMYKSSFAYYEIEARKVEVVDTTAAGDTYIGAYLSQLIKNINIEERMKYATIASSLTIQRKGAQSSIPCTLEIEKALKGE